MSAPTFYDSSQWARWDLHLHAPGTALNDQFGGEWKKYLDRIRSAQPRPKVLGITDYCSLNCYVDFLRESASVDLNGIELVLPNIEFRLSPETVSGRAIHAHLVISPETRNHIERVEEALSRLTVSFGGNPFPCTRQGLIRLGRLHLRDETAPDVQAYKEGVNQFKVDATIFLKWLNDEGWIRRNSLLGVAAGEDGLSGLRRDSGFQQHHDEIVRQADLIFSSQESDRLFYLGQRAATPRQIKDTYNSLMPCVHGSDAHDINSVLQPALNRYCWIKAAPTFDGLRQILYEPADRVHIGDSPPSNPDPDHVIQSISITNHEGWFETEHVPISPYYTAIIGEKGSGKTALVDVLAAAGKAWSATSGSFLSKAGDSLQKALVEVKWQSGRTSKTRIEDLTSELEPEVLYLSQQFVERLCSGDLLADELVSEVERVIFDHIPEPDRLNTGSFPELRKRKTEDLHTQRSEIRQQVLDLNDVVDEYSNALSSDAKTKADLEKAKGELKQRKDQQKTLVSKSDKKAAEMVATLQESLSEMQTNAGKLKSKLTSLNDIRSTVNRARLRSAEWYAAIEPTLVEIGVPAEYRSNFVPGFSGDTEEPLRAAETALKSELNTIEGDPDEPQPGSIAFVKQQLVIQNKKLNLDKARSEAVTKVGRHISRLQSQVNQLQEAIKTIERIRTDDLPNAQKRRLEEYLKYFALVAEEREILYELYAPLKHELGSRSTGEANLQFSVRVIVDVESWAARGENMLDLRRSGAFSKKGALQNTAETLLKEAWATGDRDAIENGIREVVDGIKNNLSEILRVDYKPKDVAEWLFSVDHIRLDYTIRYNDVELRYLSPGTRGIVLLILYLAVDRIDDRPLVIDQPEENLDNASVYDVLVDYFREAKKRRQIIVVTHNPNLVVNTDAETVVIAQARRRANGLPVMKYSYGPLELTRPLTHPSVRDFVCAILEGGEDAFLRREQRYSLHHKARGQWREPSRFGEEH